MLMEGKKQILINHIQQKFVRIANVARIKEEDGKSNDEEFICLKKLYSLLIFLTEQPEPTFDQLRKAELLANNICGRTFFPYRPMDWSFLEFDPVQPGTGIDMPISACDITYSHQSNLAENDTVCSYLDYIMGHITYEHPWIQFAVLNGYGPGKYEVGSPSVLTEVSVTVNKLALEQYFIDFEGELTGYARELKDNLPNQFVQLDFQTAQARTFTLKGNYHDLQKYKGENLPAETEMVWQSVWPCYYGTGPVNAMDNPATRNQFMQSLTKILDCPSCIDVSIPEGHVFWYFYPYQNPKLFKTDNGVITGSFKGTFPGRTKSMDDYNVAGSFEYGVIRTGEEGISCLRICLVDVLLCDVEDPRDPVYEDPEIEEPEVPEEPEPEPVVEFDSEWSDLVCVLEEE